MTDRIRSTDNRTKRPTEPVRVDMSALDGSTVRATVENGGRLELHDSTRPDAPPVVLDDFLMAVMRGEVS